MNTFLTFNELSELSDMVRHFTDRFAESTLTLETTVVDSNGEFVGYIRFSPDDMTYVFVDDLSVLD